MSELEDKINSILGDPAQMDMISNLAKSLMGGDGEAQTESPALDGLGDMGGLADMARSFLGGGGGGGGDGGIDPQMLGKISRLMSAGSRKDEKTVLLEAMKPYLSEKRRSKMDKALSITRLAKLAGLALGESGGDGDV